jgi:predicted amidophosphoribosyltransferase
MTQQMTKIQCPYCREPVSPLASRCPHCLSDLSIGNKEAIELILIAILVFSLIGILNDLFG